jgi:hypothetical protein
MVRLTVVVALLGAAVTGLLTLSQPARADLLGPDALVPNSVSNSDLIKRYLDNYEWKNSASKPIGANAHASFGQWGGKVQDGIMDSTEKTHAAAREEPAKGVTQTHMFSPVEFQLFQDIREKGYNPENDGLLTNNASDAAIQVKAQDAAAKQSNMPGAGKEAAKSNQNAEKSSTADNLAAMERIQAGTALDFMEEYSLKNFTTNGGNQWNQVRDRLFIPMAILLLLPGAVLAQVKSIASQGFAVLGEIGPFEGLQRSMIAIFLIPATYLVVNYGIDVHNSISYTIRTEYMNIFGTDMYEDAMCAHIRAFPIRYPEENFGTIPNLEADMYPLLNWTTPLARLEGKTLEVKLEDPCAMLYIVPRDRAAETVPYYVNEQRVAYNQANAAFAMAWTLLCAFQIAYLYYLWFVGPVVAALWVYPMKQLRDAFPSWLEGVVCLCFWALFWNTSVLLMACFRGVDETGTIAMTALNFLTISSVKFAFDFSGLVKDAGRQAASLAQKAAERAAQGGGKGGGKGGGGGGGGGGKSASNSGGHAPANAGANSAAAHANAGSAPAPANAKANANADGASSPDLTANSGTVTGTGGDVTASSSSHLGVDGSSIHSNAPPLSQSSINAFAHLGSHLAGPLGYFGVQPAGNDFNTGSFTGSSSDTLTGGPGTDTLTTPGGDTVNNAHFNQSMAALHMAAASGSLHLPGGGMGHGHGLGHNGIGQHGGAFHGVFGGHHGAALGQHHGQPMGTHALAHHALAAQAAMAAANANGANFGAVNLPNSSMSFNLSSDNIQNNLNALTAQLAGQPGIPMTDDGMGGGQTTVDYARMASDPDASLSSLGFSGSSIASIDQSTTALGGSIANADALARDTQSMVQGQIASQQASAMQQQIQQQQDQFNQMAAAGMAPGQQAAMQAVQQQQVADLFRQQQADNTAWQQQQAQAAAQPMNDAQRSQFNQQVQEQAQARAEQQAQQMQAVMQQQRDQQAAIMAQNAAGQNPAQQAMMQQQLDHVQQQIAATVQQNMAHAQTVAQAELGQQLMRAATDAAAGGFASAPGIMQVQGNLLDTAQMAGTSADGQFFRADNGSLWKNDAMGMNAPNLSPVTPTDGLLRTADGGITVGGASMPTLEGGNASHIAGMVGSGGNNVNIDSSYIQNAASAAANAAYLASNSVSGGGSGLFDFNNTATNMQAGAQGGFTDHVVDGAGNLFTAQRDQQGNLVYVGQNGEVITPGRDASGVMTFHNSETGAIASTGGSIEARINAENSVLSRAASAEVSGPATMSNSLQGVVTGQPGQVNLEGQRTVNLDGVRPETLSRDGGVTSTNLSNAASEIGTSIGAGAGASISGNAADNVGSGITQVQGDLLSKSQMAGNSADGQTFRANDGTVWKNDATGTNALPPVSSADGQQYSQNRGIQPTPENFMMGAAAAGAAHLSHHQDPITRHPAPGQPAYVDQPGISQQRTVMPGAADPIAQKRETVNRLDKQVNANSPKIGAPGGAAAGAAGIVAPGMLRNAITKALGKAATNGTAGSGTPAAGAKPKPNQGSPKSGLGTPGKGASNRVDNPMSDVTKGSTLRRYKKPKALSEKEKAELERAARESGNWLV